MAYWGNDSAFIPGLVYLIRNGDGEIIYIGQTIDLRRRMTDHRSPKSPFRHEIASVEILHMKTPAERNQREIELIRAHRPRYNIAHNTGSPGVMKRTSADWTDTERAAIRAAIDELVPTGQTGVLRDDLVAAIREVIRRRQENGRLGALMFNALHRDSGTWRAVAYLTGIERTTASRWGEKVIPDEAS